MTLCPPAREFKEIVARITSRWRLRKNSRSGNFTADAKTMKRKMPLLAALLLALPFTGAGQGTFGNLNFEQANPVPAGQPFIVAASNGIPGWVSYLGPTIFYDTVSLGGAAISLHDSASLFYQPLQGSYGILLQGSGAGPDVSAAIGQTAQIPIGSLSLRYWADPLSRLQVTFGGQLIEMVKLGSTVNYDVLGGDISMFAGQTAELRFTGPANSGGYFDNIFFSTQQIPEPNAPGLLGLGALLFGCRSRCRWFTAAASDVVQSRD